MGKNEEDAAAKKRSEAAKKAAATRKAKQEQEAAEKTAAEQNVSQQQSSVEPSQTDEPQVEESEDEDRQTGAKKWLKRRTLSVNDIVDLENHRADVNPGDQAVQHDTRQGELDAEREIHNLRTGGRKWRELVGNAVGRMRW